MEVWWVPSCGPRDGALEGGGAVSAMCLACVGKSGDDKQRTAGAVVA